MATTNPGKVRELRAMLSDLPVRLVGMDEVGLSAPAETGATFAANATLKARHAADASGFLVLADDSGLEVDGLGGAPGVHSARYAGDGADDEANRRRLIRELRDVPPAARTGRFRCAIAIAQLAPPGAGAGEATVTVVEGTCEGLLLTEPRGDRGFGYDPLFLLPERGLTMAELPDEEKNVVSHRARALALALPGLRRLLVHAGGDDA